MDQEIKDSEDFLLNLHANGGFKVPENYFENLNASLLETTKEKEKSILKIRWRNLYGISSVAASIFIVAGFFMFDPKLKSTTEPNVEDIISHLQTEELSIDLLCEAGWCTVLDQTEQRNSDLEEEILLETETDLIITEL